MKKKLLDRMARYAAVSMILVGAGLGLFQTASAQTALPQEVIINGVEFVHIPEGWFYKTGGQPPAGQDFLIHEQDGGGNVKVWLDSFYLAKYEARARDLVSYLNSPAGRGLSYAGDTLSCSTRLNEKENKYVQLRPHEDLPATHLNWSLANSWARWMGFRLPDEMEWEKGARGTDKRTFPWGDDWPDDTFAGYQTDSDCHTWPVNSFLKGRSPYGLHNMAGNVREFVADWYDMNRDRMLKDGDRNLASVSNGTVREFGSDRAEPNESGPWKILKGGRWASHAEQLRIGARIYYTPEAPFRCNGTRFAIDVAAVREHLAKGTARVSAP